MTWTVANCEWCRATFVDKSKCHYPAEHEERAKALALDPDAIRAWSKRQAESGGNFGGTCEFDHDAALELIDLQHREFIATRELLAIARHDAKVLSEEVERLRQPVEYFIRVPKDSLPLRITGGGCLEALLPPNSDTMIRFAEGTSGLVIRAEEPEQSEW